MEADSLALVNKLFPLQNRIKKIVLIETVPIPKYFDIHKIIMVYPCSFLRRISSNPRFIGLTCPAKGYTT